MSNALAEAAQAFEDQLKELGLSERTEELGDLAELGRRGALLAVADTIWRTRLELLERDDVQRLLRVGSRQAVHELTRRRRLIAVPGQSGHLFPAFQFGSDGRPYALMPDLLRIFEQAEAQPHTIASWFVTPQKPLDGKTPAEWLRDGREKGPILEAAQRSAARLAH